MLLKRAGRVRFVECEWRHNRTGINAFAYDDRCFGFSIGRRAVDQMWQFEIGLKLGGLCRGG